MTKIMFVGAHPDDEVFLPGATLAKYAQAGHRIRVVCATRGEAGMWSDVPEDGRSLGEVREEEQRQSAKILGFEGVEYLNLFDGTIGNNQMQTLVDGIKEQIDCYHPEIVVTLDQMGISGHLDHIAVSQACWRVFDQTEEVKKLYFYTISRTAAEEKWVKNRRCNWGRREEEITTRIDIGEWVEKKIEAARCHRTQAADVVRLEPIWKARSEDVFVLAKSRVESQFPETDLLAGI